MSENDVLASVNLSDILNALREQILQAQIHKAGGPNFTLKELEVSLETVVTRSSNISEGANITFKVPVLEAGMEFGQGDSSSSAHTHRITLKLEVKDADNNEFKVSDTVPSPRAKQPD